MKYFEFLRVFSLERRTDPTVTGWRYMGFIKFYYISSLIEQWKGLKLFPEKVIG